MTRPELVGIGLDSVDIPRFADALARRPSLLLRLFTADERAYAGTLTNPVPSLAVRFAAKEAVMKCLGVGLGAFDWWDVDVVRASTGRPGLAVSGRAAGLAAGLGVGGWHVSLTHTATVASAVVAAVGGERWPDAAGPGGGPAGPAAGREEVR